jgi:hypothetical protein
VLEAHGFAEDFVLGELVGMDVANDRQVLARRLEILPEREDVRALRGEGLIRGIESIHELDLGLGPQLKLNYSSKEHKGFDHVTTRPIVLPYQMSCVDRYSGSGRFPLSLVEGCLRRYR